MMAMSVFQLLHGLFEAGQCSRAPRCCFSREPAAAAATAPAGAGAAARGAMAVPVEMVTLAEEPVEQVGEFVGTIKSRRSTTIQPQAEGLPPADPGQVGRRVSRRARRCSRSTRRRSRRRVASLESHARRARGRRDVRAAAGRARQDAARRRRDEPAGVRPGAGAAADGRGPAQGGRRADPAADAELAYYRVVAPTAGVVGDVPVRAGRSRDARDGADDDRGQHRPRALRQRARAGGAAAQARPAGAAPRRGRRDDRDRADHLHLAVGRRHHADGAGEDADRDPRRRVPVRSVRARQVVWSHGAGADRAGRRGVADQRPVLRVRRRSRATAGSWSRSSGRSPSGR